MVEKEYEVKVIQVVWPCEKCGKGEMEFQSGDVRLAVITPFKKHKCNICGHTDDARNKIYPFIKYERWSDKMIFLKNKFSEGADKQIS